MDAGTADEAGLAARLAVLRERIAAAAARSGRPPEAVTLMAVTKNVPAARIRAAYALGADRPPPDQQGEGGAGALRARAERR